MQDSMRQLWSKSDNFFIQYMSGALVGRRLNVWDIMRNYFDQFRSIGTHLFSYSGIDEHLTREIEKRLFFFGRVGLVLKDRELIAVNANPNGTDIYKEPTGFSFAFGGGIEDNSKTPGERIIGVDSVFGLNTFSMYPTALICEQYALEVAHADMSIIAEMVNGRFMDVLKAHSNSDAESAGKFCKDLYDGKLSFITDKTEDLEIDRSSRSVTHLRELIDTKDRILRDFYNIMGINKTAEKRERMITEEAEANTKLLSFNLKDMLECRKEMCKHIGEVFNRKVSVKSHIDIDSNGLMENEQEMEGGNNNDGV